MNKLAVIVVCGVALLSAGVAIGASRAAPVRWPASCETWRCVNRHLNDVRSTAVRRHQVHLVSRIFNVDKPAGQPVKLVSHYLLCPGGQRATGGGVSMPNGEAPTSDTALDSYPLHHAAGWRADFAYRPTDPHSIAGVVHTWFKLWVVCT
jgi:hypothetical protein